MAAAPHPVLTLDALENRPGTGTGLAVLGHPVAHSLSPAMHTAALAELAAADPRFRDWHYEKFDIAPGDLPRALAQLHTRGFVGVNLTVPHKEAGLARAESADDFARAAGAANTLLRTATGWHAANTDGAGLADALRREFGLELSGRPVLLLGAGGAARAAAAQCLREGVASLWIGNRGTGRLSALLAQLEPIAGGRPVRGFSLEQIPPELPDGAVVINATSLGLQPDAPAPLDLSRLSAPVAVFDMIYNPPSTALLRQAAKLGLPHAHGLAMLAYQGAHALARWAGRPAPAEVMLRAAQAALSPPPA